MEHPNTHQCMMTEEELDNYYTVYHALRGVINAALDPDVVTYPDSVIEDFNKIKVSPNSLVMAHVLAEITVDFAFFHAPDQNPELAIHVILDAIQDKIMDRFAEKYGKEDEDNEDDA